MAKVSAEQRGVDKALQDVADKLTVLAQELIERGMQTPLDMVHYPARLHVTLMALSSVVADADTVPTPLLGEVFHDLATRLERQLACWREVFTTAVAS